MGFYDDLDAQRQQAPVAPAPTGSRSFYGDLDPQQPVPLPPERPAAAAEPSLPYRIYRALGGYGTEDVDKPPQLPSLDTTKEAPSKRLENTIGFWPTLGAQLFPPTGAILGGLDMQYHTNRGEFGSAALAGAPAGMGAGPKVLKDVAKLGFEAPSTSEMFKTGGAQIEQYRNLPKAYVGSDISALTGTMKNAISPVEAPLTSHALEMLADQAKHSPYVTPKMIDDFRIATSEASKKGEVGAMKARDLLYDYLSKTGDPADNLLMTGIKNWAGGKRGEAVEKVLRAGAGRTEEGVRLDTAARSLVDNRATRLRGFTNDEVAALDKARGAGSGLFTAGDVVSGRTFGGPLGAGAFSFPAGVGAIGAGLTGSATGGAAVMLPPVAGWALRKGGTALRREAIEDVASMVRGRSPIGEAARAAYETGPVATQGARNAIARALMQQGPQNTNEGSVNYLLDKTINPFIYGGM